jgi:hypothetical protein
VVVDRLGGDEQAPGDVGVAQPLGDQRQHFGLPGREVGRVGAGAGTGPSRQAPDPQLPQFAGDRSGQGSSAQLLELGQRRAELRLLVAVDEGGGGLVGAAERPPAGGRGTPVARHLQRERLGRGRPGPRWLGAGRARPAATARRQARRPASANSGPPSARPGQAPPPPFRAPRPDRLPARPPRPGRPPPDPAVAALRSRLPGPPPRPRAARPPGRP